MSLNLRFAVSFIDLCMYIYSLGRKNHTRHISKYNKDPVYECMYIYTYTNIYIYIIYRVVLYIYIYIAQSR